MLGSPQSPVPAIAFMFYYFIGTFISFLDITKIVGSFDFTKKCIFVKLLFLQSHKQNCYL